MLKKNGYFYRVKCGDGKIREFINATKVEVNRSCSKFGIISIQKISL